MTLPHVLLLGGTGEARTLSQKLANWPVFVTTSLAAVTQKPSHYSGSVRRGGFGGAEGMARFMSEQKIGVIIDATHPFAERITRNANSAALATGTPFLRLQRAAWTSDARKSWIHVGDLHSAVNALPRGARAFLAVGAGRSGELKSQKGIDLFVRSIEPIKDLSPGIAQLQARPPFTLDQELETFRTHGITHLVTRNSGGMSGREKLDAAAQLGLQVIVIDRPPLPEGIEVVSDVEGVLDWLRQRLALDTSSALPP